MKGNETIKTFMIRGATHFQSTALKGKDHLVEADVDGRIILN